MKKICYFLFASLILTACNKDGWDGSDGTETGYFTLKSLTSNGDFISKSTETSGVDIDAFRIDLENKSTGEKFVYKYSDMKDDMIELPVGTYTLKAGTDADDNAVGYNLPIYRGEYDKELVIKNSVLSDASLTCHLTNMKVSLTFSDEFIAEVDDYSVIVTADALVGTEYTSFLIFDKDHMEGYFPPSDLTVHVRGSKTDAEGKTTQINHVVKIEEGTARDWHLIDITAVPTGYGNFSVAVDYTLNEREVGILIPGEDEDDLGPVDPVDPVDPGPEPGDPITISAPGISSPLEINKANAGSVEVKIDIKAEKGIENLIVRIDSPFLTEQELGSIDIPAEFDLANLGNPSLQSAFELIGLLEPGEAVKGKTTFTVDISVFMELLVGQLDDIADHNFHVTVRDADGNEKKVTIVIRTLE